MNKSILSLLIVLISISLSAQKLNVSYHFEKESLSFQKTINLKTLFKDSVSLLSYLDEMLEKSRELGFLETSVDSILYTSALADVYLFTGKKYKTLKVRYDRKYEDILLSINSKYLLSDFIDVKKIKVENEKIIEYLENNAYPFSKVFLDSINLESQEITAFLNIERGQKIRYDTVSISGNLQVSKSFLYGYTGIRPDDFYSDKKLKAIQKKINDLPFAQQNQECQIQYKEDKIKVDIPANKLKSNRFDGILGILPNDETTGQLVLTGEINIFLQNILRSAESLNFKWQKLESTSQKLSVGFEIPYIFNTKLGLSSALDLHKQDSVYLNSALLIGSQYYFNGQNNIGIQFRSKTSSILSKDSIIKQQLKPYHLASTALTFKYQALDYVFNPHRGIDFNLNAGIGNKETETEDFQKNSFIQYDAFLHLKYYLPIAKKHTILLANQTAFLFSEVLYKNELYRIGGLNSLRGFMESSIYASSYSIVSMEYRFIFEPNSAMFVFFDGAWYEKQLEQYYYDYPFGFGFGLFFKTKAGVFTISYAIGQQKNEHINIKNAKIHFGFINRF